MSAPETNGEPKDPQSVVPQWLTSELFETVLKENVAGYKKIRNFKANPALTAGENYATIMLRVDLEIELEDNKTKDVSYMLKLGHDNPLYLEMMSKHNIFDIERGMYTTIVPEMEQMYRDVGLDVKFGAKCLKLPTEKWHVLLEDLRPRGFKNANRLDGLDVEHTKCVLKKMALWHAAGATRFHTKGPYPDIYMYGFFTESQFETIKEMMKALSTPFMKCVKLYQGHEVYYDSLEKNQKGMAEEIFKSCTKFDMNEFNVLNHGDCWCNNIMFQYDAFGKIKETYLVDYQIPKFGTPAQDLFYFLLSSTKLEIKLKQFDYFIKFYHDSLIEALKLLKYPKKLPSLKDIHIGLYKYGVWGISTVTGVMAAVLLDPTEKANFDNFLSDSEAGNDFKILMFSNERYRKHVEVILPWLYNRGAMELS